MTSKSIRARNDSDPNSTLTLIQSGAGNSRVFELRAPMMARNRLTCFTMCSRSACNCDVSGAYIPPPIHTSAGET